MDFFGILTLFGGLAMFLYGMNVMGDGLAKAAGGKLEQILEKLTNTPIKGVLLGAAVTAVIQSSSATTVMVVGFVNSGIMKLNQAVGIIMGANVGTTVTSWILSLSGIESNNFWIRMLKPSSFSPILAVIGIIFLMFSKSEKKHDIGGILLGFAVLMFGMESMSGAVKPLANVPEFTSILTMFANPVFGMIAGAVLTAVIQSSSASVGILQALSATGSVSFGVALPIIMGQNIGTCVTALISAVGAKKNAKRAAFVHLYFNLLGTVIFMVVFYTINGFMHFGFLGTAANAAGIAVIHSVFNIVATILLLPFSWLLEKMATATVQDTEADRLALLSKEQEYEDLKLLDSRFLEKPAFAVAQSMEVAKRMAVLSKDAILESMSVFETFDAERAQHVIALENQVDRYDDELGTYLVKLSSKHLSQKDSQTTSLILHSIGDFERISDHAINIVETASAMQNKKQRFSEKAQYELQVYGDAIKEILDKAVRVFDTGDLLLASEIEPLEEVIDSLHSEIKKRHIKRLQKGKCTIELGIALEDLITNYERVADHCSNIGVSMIQINADGFETHEYLEKLKKENNADFESKYNMYKQKYSIKKETKDLD
ncbi:MAG: Na/Pi cotransporter family protein [Lachnospiraceae bacterium]|nr:Na/Pi cotransporter family protein [Lachnospiraceae bacterium]